MSKKKAPALHERRGREDISTRPPRLAGSPIKLAGKTRLRRLSLAADSCVNRKYYGGDPGVGQRARGFVHKPCIRSGREGQGEFSVDSARAEGHLMWPSCEQDCPSRKPYIPPLRRHTGAESTLSGPAFRKVSAAKWRCRWCEQERGTLLKRAPYGWGMGLALVD